MAESTIFFKKLMENQEFRASFIKNPGKIFSDSGITCFEGKDIKVYENDAFNRHYALLDKGSDLKPFENMDRKFIALQQKVWDDIDFKKRLLAAPAAVVSEVFGALPEKLNIHIHENNGNIVNIIIPALNCTNELSDDDLEMIAGGKGSVTSVAETVLDTTVDVAGKVIDNIPSAATDTVSTVYDAFLWVNNDAVDSIPTPNMSFFTGW